MPNQDFQSMMRHMNLLNRCAFYHHCRFIGDVTQLRIMSGMKKQQRIITYVLCITFLSGIISLFITTPWLAVSVNYLVNYVRPTTKPKIMLWAWERPETLSCLDSNKIGVAFYAGTINLIANDFYFQPRLQPLVIPKSVYLEAVFRINNKTGSNPQLSNSATHNLLATITKIAARPGIKSIQIDYDAKETERPFYRNLLVQLRAALPPQLPLSMTALASWCLGDNWLTNLPVDEIAPMLFDMGAGRQDVLSFIKFAKLQQISLLQKCVGLSTTEPNVIDVLQQRFTNCPQRIYFFSVQPWNLNRIETAKTKTQTWL